MAGSSGRRRSRKKTRGMRRSRNFIASSPIRKIGAAVGLRSKGGRMAPVAARTRVAVIGAGIVGVTTGQLFAAQGSRRRASKVLVAPLRRKPPQHLDGPSSEPARFATRDRRRAQMQGCCLCLWARPYRHGLSGQDRQDGCRARFRRSAPDRRRCLQSPPLRLIARPTGHLGNAACRRLRLGSRIATGRAEARVASARSTC